MHKKINVLIITVIVFMNSAALKVESKFIERNGLQADINKGLRLTRINVKQSVEIEKVYEVDGSNNIGIDADDSNSIGIGLDGSDDSAIAKLWPQKDTPREISSVHRKDFLNREKLGSLSRKSLEEKTTPVIQAENLQSKLNFEVTTQINPESISKFNPEAMTKFNPEVITKLNPDVKTKFYPVVKSQFKPKIVPKFNPAVKSKFENKSETTKKENMSRKFEKTKLRKYKKSYGRTNEKNNPKTKPSKEIKIIERIRSSNSYKNNINPSINNEEAKIERAMSAKTKPAQKSVTCCGKKKKSNSKPVQNLSPIDKLKSKKPKLRAMNKYKTKTVKKGTEKLKTSKKNFNLDHFNNQRHYKSFLIGATGKPKTKSNNVKKGDTKANHTLGKTYTSLKTIQENNSLKPGEKIHRENVDANVADIVNGFNRLSLKMQKRVIDKVLSRHHNFKRVSEKYSSTSAIIPPELNSTPVSFPYGINSTSISIPQAINTTPVNIPYTLNNTSAMIPHALYSTSVDILQTISTRPVDLSEAHSATTVLPVSYGITPVDFSDIYDTLPDDLSKPYSTITEESSTQSVNPTNNIQEFLGFEENVSQSYENFSSTKLFEKARFNSKMLKEFSEIYSMAPPIDDSVNSFDVPPITEANIVQKVPNRKQKRRDSQTIQKGVTRVVRTKKNKEDFPKNIKDIAGALYNYFTLLPHNKRRGTQEDIPRKVNSFFDKMSKPSRMRSSKHLRSDDSMPVLITIRSRDIDTSTDYDKIRMREFYYNDYDADPENKVMDTIGDLSEKFAA